MNSPVPVEPPDGHDVHEAYGARSASGAAPPAPLVLRALPSEALQVAARFARALERYLGANGGATSRAQIVAVVRTWVPRWSEDVPPVFADALIEGLLRQGKVVATRHFVGTVAAVEHWRTRFARYPQRLTQPPEQVASECDLPVGAVRALRALTRAGK